MTLILSDLDVELLPHIWRTPDRVERGNMSGSLLFCKEMMGNVRMTEWRISEKAAQVRSLVVKALGTG